MKGETANNGHGGKRTGAGRPKSDSHFYAFRIGGDVAKYIDRHENKSAHIIDCIRACMDAEGPDFSQIGESWAATDITPLEVPSFGVRVVAGFPIPLSNDERAQKIDVLRMLCPHPESTYLIQVRGDSMIDANINDGDILVVDKSRRNPSENEVAMCEVNGEYTVKYVRWHDHKCWLVPANKDYPEIEISEADDFCVWGIITFVIHRPLSV